MTLVDRTTGAGNKVIKLGFKTSIIALFVAIVLVIGLTLVYLSFSRISAVTRLAASSSSRRWRSWRRTGSARN